MGATFAHKSPPLAQHALRRMPPGQALIEAEGPTVTAELTWRSRDGLELYARDYGARETERLPVICIPGLTRNSRDFETLAPWIAAQGRRVLAVDLRGRGRSAYDPKPRRYRPAVYANDMAALLKAIGARKAVFVGTSLGGLTTMMLAMRHPRLIGAAVLNDVGPRVAKAGLARIASYTGKSAPVGSWSDAAAYAKRINGAALPHLTDADWDVVARRLFRAGADGAPVLDYDLRVVSKTPGWLISLTEPLLWSACRKLARSGPLLVLRGATSDILDQPTLRRMSKLAPNVSATEIPDVGHAPSLDEPAARDALADFLARAP
jgi:pimeloyl-ACP methyl ester carboxylesterase